MPDVECEQCGTTFDPTRDPATPGASTERCPHCGTTADLEAAEAAPESTTVEASPGTTVRITIEVLPADPE